MSARLGNRLEGDVLHQTVFFIYSAYVRASNNETSLFVDLANIIYSTFMLVVDSSEISKIPQPPILLNNNGEKVYYSYDLIKQSMSYVRVMLPKLNSAINEYIQNLRAYISL